MWISGDCMIKVSILKWSDFQSNDILWALNFSNKTIYASNQSSMIQRELLDSGQMMMPRPDSTSSICVDHRGRPWLAARTSTIMTNGPRITTPISSTRNKKRSEEEIMNVFLSAVTAPAWLAIKLELFLTYYFSSYLLLLYFFFLRKLWSMIITIRIKRWKTPRGMIDGV